MQLQAVLLVNDWISTMLILSKVNVIYKTVKLKKFMSISVFVVYKRCSIKT